MIIGPRRLLLIGIVGAVAAVIVLLPFFTFLAYPLPHQLPVTISIVRVLNERIVEIHLDVFNPNLGALDISKIEYDLYADGEFVGKSKLDYSNVPPTGQPQLLSRQTTTLVSTVTTDLKLSPDAYWRASGTIEIGNAFTLGQREFTAYFQ